MAVGIGFSQLRTRRKATVRKQHWLALALLIGSITVGLSVAQQPKPAPPPLPAAVAQASGVGEGDVVKVLNVLGPEIVRQLAAGKEVGVPGLGTFRVVKLSEQRNLEDGRPVVQPAKNVVIFVADEAANQVVNTGAAAPKETVPAFQYVPLPTQ